LIELGANKNATKHIRPRARMHLAVSILYFVRRLILAEESEGKMSAAKKLREIEKYLISIGAESLPIDETKI
jgi:hypothetical protein